MEYTTKKVKIIKKVLLLVSIDLQDNALPLAGFYIADE